MNPRKTILLKYRSSRSGIDPNGKITKYGQQWEVVTVDT
jgi:hypothetical protein